MKYENTSLGRLGLIIPLGSTLFMKISIIFLIIDESYSSACVLLLYRIIFLLGIASPFDKQILCYD